MDLNTLLLSVVLAVLPAEGVTKGEVQFRPAGDESRLPERYRLEAHTFPFEMKPLAALDGLDVDVYEVRFPSPVESKHPENNMVYAEYYRPRGDGPFPAAIVLDVLAGDQSLSRLQARLLAQNKVAALFVQMAYYGPRRPPKSRVRMIMPDIDHSLGAVRQTVLDLRRASAWLESRPEVDKQRLAIMGTSLGSFLGTLTAEMEARLSRVVIVLGGGGLVDAFYDHPHATAFRLAFEALGGSKETIAAIVGPADPITHAANLIPKKVLMIGARRDEIVPPKATEALWAAAGKPRIVWYDCTHEGAAMYFFPAMREVLIHLLAPVEEQPAGDQALRAELLNMVKEDQDARFKMLEWVKEQGNKDPMAADAPELKRVEEIDVKNTARMKEIIAKHGWPGKSLVGKDGAHAAWLLVQHADRDPAFQTRCLELMKEGLKKGEVTGQDLAYLTDRVLVAQKKKQLYGTQFTQKDGEFVPQPIEDAARVDERRKELGLSPLAEYKKRIEEMYKAKK